MSTYLAAYTLWHNIKCLKYPYLESFRSAEPIVDKFVIVVAGPHEDDTLQEAFNLGNEYPDKVIVVHGPDQVVCDAKCEVYWLPEIAWPKKPYDHNRLSFLVNEGMNFCSDGTDDGKLWCFQLQADEILDENDYYHLLQLPSLPNNFDAASWRFRHYCGDFRHIDKFMYAAADYEDVKFENYPRRIVRACRYASDWVNVGDAVQMQGTGDVYESPVIVHHMGQISVGRAREAAKGKYDFQTQLYVGSAFAEADPRVVSAYKSGEGLDFFNIGTDIREFGGPWPKWVKEYAKSLGVEL